MALPADTPARERHGTLYFTDGDVVLEASHGVAIEEDAPPISLFRVHRWLLTHHSPSLPAMFGEIGTEDEIYDGAPVVKMVDDAHDLEGLLQLLYCPFENRYRRFDPCKPLLVAGPLRLARKYEMESLAADLVKCVVDDWPLTLQAYDRWYAELSEIRRTHDASADPPFYFADHVPEPVAAINFAREFGCTEILPAAFYRLATISLHARWDPHDPHTNTALGSGKPVAGWDVLPALDHVRALSGKLSLGAFIDLVCTVDSPEFDAGECENEGEDEERMARVMEPMRAHYEGEVYSALRLLGLLDANPEAPMRALCPSCQRGLKEWIAETREELWDSLPRRFEIEI